MTFTDQIRRWVATVQTNERRVFDGTVAEAKRSIVEGSAITGAPGQPVALEGQAAGKLRDSWTEERPSVNEAVISTPVDYAPEVEDNIHGFTFHNHGAHSLKLTVAGFGRIVEAVTKRVAGNV